MSGCCGDLSARRRGRRRSRGGIWALLAAAPVYATANLILGFAFSALAESQMRAMQGAVFFYLPSMLLSGFMFPFQGMPGWARGIGEVLPLTHFVRAAPRSSIEGSRRCLRRPGDVARRSIRVSGRRPRPCRIPPPH